MPLGSSSFSAMTLGALALVAGDCIDLAGHEQRAHEHRALVAAAQATRIEDAALVDLDLEARAGP